MLGFSAGNLYRVVILFHYRWEIRPLVWHDVCESGNHYRLNYVLVTELPVRIATVTVCSRTESAVMCNKWVSCDNFQYRPHNGNTDEGLSNGNCSLLEWYVRYHCAHYPLHDYPCAKRTKVRPLGVHTQIRYHSQTLCECSTWSKFQITIGIFGMPGEIWLKL